MIIVGCFWILRAFAGVGIVRNFHNPMHRLATLELLPSARCRPVARCS